MTKKALIIGAGPAGLSAGYGLLKETDIIPIIVEELDCLGGISRTIFHNGNGIDLGPHRLFTKNSDVLEMWEHFLPLQGKPPIDDKILGRTIETSPNGPDPDEDDKVMLKRKRLSRIYYSKKFFDYPISLSLKTILNMGLFTTFKAGCSYIKSAFFKVEEKSLEDFMINRFGKVLYQLFFEKYTQKVWGLHPKNISKEWGEQRIKGLSLSKAVMNAISKSLKIFSASKETSLIEEYYYPKFGCGQLWQAIADEITERGGEIRLSAKVVGFKNSENRINSVIVEYQNGEKEEIQADYVISSMPIKNLISGMDSVPEEVTKVASDLPYRDYVWVGFYLDGMNLKNNTKIPTFNDICPDSWIYLQDEKLTAGRMQIVNNFSPYIVKDFKNKVFIGLEYFASVGDELWSRSDEEMLEVAKRDLKQVNITNEENILDNMVVRVEKAYPSYFGSYKDFGVLRNYLDSFENLYCIGRNGQHKYNNMDHSMLSGLVAANVIKNQQEKSVLWNVNTEAEYHEGIKEGK